MTLRDLIAAHPDCFYPQTWYEGEAFMDTPLPLDAPLAMPRGVYTILPSEGMALPMAVELAALYVRNPTDPLWRRYLWCADLDSHGQRVYLGVNNGLMEIHRHIHTTERFGVPVWG